MAVIVALGEPGDPGLAAAGVFDRKGLSRAERSRETGWSWPAGLCPLYRGRPETQALADDGVTFPPYRPRRSSFSSICCLRVVTTG